MGMVGPQLSWFTSYLSQRPTKVVFNGASSSFFHPTSGVPQGSILGPLLFIIYVDDLSAILSSSKFLYADDVKVGRVINGLSDCLELQDDLFRLASWCDSNQLTLNADKCSVLTVSNKTTHNVTHAYTLPGGHDLVKRDSVKDLGVHFDEDLRFQTHIDQLVDKAFRTLGFVIRTSRGFRRLASIMHLYRHLVLPQLDYACSIWSPYYLNHVAAVEAVQRRFTRFVFRKFDMQYCDYHSRAKKLNLLSLRRRRTLFDQVLLFKLVNGQLAVNSGALNVGVRTSRSTRSHDLFVEKTWRLRSTYSAPVPRMLRFYNKHMAEDFDIFADSLGDFRKKLVGLLWQLPESSFLV